MKKPPARGTKPPVKRVAKAAAKPPARRRARAAAKPVRAAQAGGLSEFDLHLFGEGTHERLYEKLGAQLAVRDGVAGVHFAVWAPNAARVGVAGDFNRWDSTGHEMQRRGPTGVWELFVPGLKAGAVYKYQILTQLRGLSILKSDPYGFAMEVRPDTASVVVDPGRYTWRDGEWMKARADRQRADRPLSIYEVHPGSWKRKGEGARDWLSWRELADELIPYVKKLGFTHLELMPVTEHPFDGSWGYQTVGYFAPTSRFGSPDDLRHFIDVAHRAGLGVILDWVPAHFPKDSHGLAYFDGTRLYEHADPRKGEHQDWGTLIFNLTRPQVRGLLLASALYWLDRFHVDGLRVDAVASMLYLDYSRKPGEWVPNRHGGRENLEAVDFLRQFNTLVHARHPGVLTFAEESTSWPRVTGPVEDGGLGFDWKWNLGWMNDTLAYLSSDPLGRAHQHRKLTFSLHYAWSEKFLLPLSHDEVVHGKRSLLLKMPGDAGRKFATLRALFAWMYAHPGKKLLFMGAELGQMGEWNFERQLTWALLEQPEHARLQAFVAELNRLYVARPALHQIDDHWDGFQWLVPEDAARSVAACMRRGREPGDRVVVVANFTPVAREGYRVPVPGPGRWKVLLDSDDERWGGGGTGEARSVKAEPLDATRDGLTHAIARTLPPLSVSWLVPVKR
jgi:1,4-alpha-glucan branching enzyme